MATTSNEINPISYPFENFRSLVDSFRYNSSGVDWCEPNYVYSPYIAELFNSISNIMFITCPPMVNSFYRGYNSVFGSQSKIVWCLIVLVGLGSAFYHATLSLFGELWDDLSILWAMSAAVWTWPPGDATDGGFKLATFRKCVFYFALAATALSFLAPDYNCSFLMFLIFVYTASLTRDTFKSGDRKAKCLFFRAIVFTFTSIAFWMIDNFACDQAFPYFHALWHLLVPVGFVYSCVLLSYFDAVRRAVPNSHPKLLWWPSHKSLPYLIPLVALESTTTTGSLERIV